MIKGSLLLYNLKFNCLVFSSGLNSSRIIFIWTYALNCRNALDRLRVHMNIILFLHKNQKHLELELGLERTPIPISYPQNAPSHPDPGCATDVPRKNT